MQLRSSAVLGVGCKAINRSFWGVDEIVPGFARMSHFLWHQYNQHLSQRVCLLHPCCVYVDPKYKSTEL